MLQAVPSNAPCQVLGRGHDPGRTPTDVWAPLCERKVPRRLGAHRSCCTRTQQSPGRRHCRQWREQSEESGQAQLTAQGTCFLTLTWRWRRWHREEVSADLGRTKGKHPLQGKTRVSGSTHTPQAPGLCTPTSPLMLPLIPDTHEVGQSGCHPRLQVLSIQAAPSEMWSIC